MKLSTLIFGIFITLCAYAKNEYAYTFEETQMMTDISYSNAIPTLEEYLQIEDGNIRKYAAAQSLFLMNTPETRAILETHLFSSPYYDFQQSIRYAFHWSMDDIRRNEFIQTYHLRSTSNQLALNIKASYPTNDRDKIEITLSIKNSTEQKLRLYKPTSYYGRYILLISPTGEVMHPHSTAMVNMRKRTPEEMYVSVSPNETFEFHFLAELKTMPVRDYTFPIIARNVLVLESDYFAHTLAHTGPFRVYGQYSQNPLKDPPFDNIWTGRVVSEPIEIELEQQKDVIEVKK